MILVFGGTTEGRKAAEVLEEAGGAYYYSTKTGEQELTLHHGIRINGAMDAEAMKVFCREHQIRLIVDAAHPFAKQLHGTIAEVAFAMQIPVVRYERIYPPRDPDIIWIDDYEQVPTDIKSLLATTGVQSISKLKWLEAMGIKVIYRILNRESSIQLAHQQGAGDDQLVYYEDGNMPNADAVLLKESGITGGFVEKVDEARKKGMRIIALKCPKSIQKGLSCTVDGPYGMRRAIEKLLPEFFPLHSGLTTGTCATAAAIAATIRLIKGEIPAEVPVILPDGETINVAVGYGDVYAYCMKEAGDDPDVTNGLEIRAKIRPIPVPSLNGGEWLVIEGGKGVGRFTLPGFDCPPGEAAINKGPREMIRNNLERLITPLHSGRGRGWVCTLSVPQGEEIARRTFNPRLGIEGGISIIGVSGIVKPFSEDAFIDSIRKCMTVAQASGSERVVINSGGKSERFVKALYPDLPQQAFVEYGNYIGETLKIANELAKFNAQTSNFTLGRRTLATNGTQALDLWSLSTEGTKELQISRSAEGRLLPTGRKNFKVTLGVMLGKAVKLAAGHLDTHSRKATMDKAFIQQMLIESDCDIDISDMTLAREIWDRLPEDKRNAFAHTVIAHCYEHCRPLLPDGELTILLIDDNGKIYGKV